MRKVNVYYGDVYAGQLVELSRGNYEFTYDDAFRADGSTPPVSVNLPKSQKVYHSERIFPVFTNMLPEGANRRALCRAKKVDENDFFGMLEMICGMDAIGKFVLKRPMFMEIPQETYALIDHSFLNDKMKRTYKRVIEERKTRFIRQSE